MERPQGAISSNIIDEIIGQFFSWIAQLKVGSVHELVRKRHVQGASAKRRPLPDLQNASPGTFAVIDDRHYLTVLHELHGAMIFVLHNVEW